MSNIVALDPKIEMSWVPKEDRGLPKEEQLTLIFRYLDMHDEAKINDELLRSQTKGKVSEYHYKISSADVKRLELSIAGWRNFNYAPDHPNAGQAVPFNKQNITLLPQNVRTDFLAFLTKRDEAQEGEDEGEDLGEAKTE